VPVPADKEVHLMAFIHEERSIEIDSAKAWAAMRLVGDAHKLFAPVLVDGTLDGDTRTVRFANGMVVKERILAVDNDHRRVAYTVLGADGITYHHASMRIEELAPGRCLFVWTTDVLPDAAAPPIAALMAQGADALKANLERL
jgi:hypothetical protein